MGDGVGAEKHMEIVWTRKKGARGGPHSKKGIPE